MSNIFTLTATTKGLKNVRPKNQTSERYTRKASTPHLQAYKHTLEHSHGQLITGAFFFGMQSCEYYATPKGEDKRIQILQNGDIIFTKNSENFPTTVG